MAEESNNQKRQEFLKRIIAFRKQNFESGKTFNRSAIRSRPKKIRYIKRYVRPTITQEQIAYARAKAEFMARERALGLDDSDIWATSAGDFHAHMMERISLPAQRNICIRGAWLPDMAINQMEKETTANSKAVSSNNAFNNIFDIDKEVEAFSMLGDIYSGSLVRKRKK